MEKKLIFTGPSERGWHRLESILRCPFLYAAKHRLDLNAESNRDPLVRGSIGHVGLAHFYARLGAQQNGLDPEAYYTPRDAMDLAAQQIGEAAEKFLEPMKKLVELYAANYRGERMKVCEVEVPVEMQIGGHRLTQRFDLVVADPHGRIYVWDHKVVSKIDRSSTNRYTLSGQFLAMIHQGRHRYGEAFAGVRVNLLQADGAKFARITPDPAPFALQQFPRMVAHAEELIARYEALDPWDYPRAFSEQVCMTAYGACDLVSVCSWGKSGVTVGSLT